jgi:hypothetical protein
MRPIMVTEFREDRRLRLQEFLNKTSALQMLMSNKRHVQNQSSPNDYQRVVG